MNDVDLFLTELTPEAAARLSAILAHMRANHPELRDGLYYGMPAWRIGKYDFIAFSFHAAHYTLHTLDFDFLETIRARHPKAKFGKGSYRIKYQDEPASAELPMILDDLVRRMPLR
ncbi:MAG TPA: hypothetical protein DCR44_02275 [Acholeplasmatales bacterium]|nr:MAG: hypothetical protein A2Y16_03490 [Tenericutes bacterium GWF2_57_13]HAQ56218.1 hypothetical protein [Acholeplasmatales bacterium]